MFTVLFVCSGNTCRSPMAEKLLLNKPALKNLPVKVCSAGIYAAPGDSISQGALAALRRRGINADGFSASLLDKEAVDGADLILTMTTAHLSAIALKFPAARARTLGDFCEKQNDIPDPFGGDANEYERCLARLDCLMDIVAQKLPEIIPDITGERGK